MQKTVDYTDCHWGKIMPMRYPQPDEIIKALRLEPLEVSATGTGEALGVDHKTLSCIVNGKSGMSPEIALRSSIAVYPLSEGWLNQRAPHDSCQADQHRADLGGQPAMGSMTAHA